MTWSGNGNWSRCVMFYRLTAGVSTPGWRRAGKPVPRPSRSFCLAVGVFLCCFAGCNSSTKPAAPQTGAAASGTPGSTGGPALTGKSAKIKVVGGYTHDFGTREVGEMFENEFIIKNEGQADLTLLKGTPSCTTCTSFEVDKTLVKPGESAKATVKWHVKTETPEFSQYAPMTTNDPSMPEIRLYAKSKIVKRLDLSPAEGWDIGSVIEGQPKEFIATLTSAVIDRFEVVSVTNSNPDLKITVTPLSAEKLAELKAKSGYEFKAVLSPTIPVGRFEDKITINIKSPDPRKLIVDAHARRNGPLEIFGPSWNAERMTVGLSAFDPRQPLVTRLSMFTRGVEGELKITKVTCADDRFSFEIKPDTRFKGQAGEHRRYEFFVKVAASDRTAVYPPLNPLLVTIDTNQKQIGQIKLKVTCQALLP